MHFHPFIYRRQGTVFFPWAAGLPPKIYLVSEETPVSVLSKSSSISP